MNRDNIINYYNGTRAYNMFLLGTMYNEPTYLEYIKDKRNISSAKVGVISSIFLATKYELLKKNISTSLIPSSELDNVVSLIANKTTNGYLIDNTYFKDPISIISFIRDNLAYGNFDLDLDNNRMIINNSVSTSIDRLSTFVISSLNLYINYSNVSEYKKNILISDRVQKGRNRRLTSKSEMKHLLKTFRNIEITLIKKDGTKVEDEVIDELNSVIEDYKVDRGINRFIAFDKKYKSKYEFKYTSNSVKDIDYDTLANELLTVMPTSIDYNRQMHFVELELQRRLSEANNILNPIISNLNNLILLELIDKYKTTDTKVLFEKNNNPGINYDSLIASSFSVFNSLFSLANDNIYKDKGDVFNLNNQGLDYSSLDLSLLDIEKIDMSNDTIDKLNNKIILLNRALNDKNRIINMQTKNLNKAKLKDNKTAIMNIMNNIDKVEAERKVISIELVNKTNELLSFQMLYKNSDDYFTNERIIEGIRNSIYNSNYDIVFDKSIEKSYIVFKDISEGKVAFKAKINVIDFINMVSDCAFAIEKFINGNNNVRVRK